MKITDHLDPIEGENPKKQVETQSQAKSSEKTIEIFQKLGNSFSRTFNSLSSKEVKSGNLTQEVQIVAKQVDGIIQCTNCLNTQNASQNQEIFKGLQEFSKYLQSFRKHSSENSLTIKELEQTVAMILSNIDPDNTKSLESLFNLFLQLNQTPNSSCNSRLSNKLKTQVQDKIQAILNEKNQLDSVVKL